MILERRREADWTAELLRARPSHEPAITGHQHPLALAGTARIVAEEGTKPGLPTRAAW